MLTILFSFFFSSFGLPACRWPGSLPCAGCSAVRASTSPPRALQGETLSFQHAQGALLVVPGGIPALTTSWEGGAKRRATGPRHFSRAGKVQMLVDGSDCPDSAPGDRVWCPPRSRESLSCSLPALTLAGKCPLSSKVTTWSSNSSRAAHSSCCFRFDSS